MEKKIGGITVLVKRGDITEEKADAIVNPANSKGSMGGGVALAIMRGGGREIEKEAMGKSPIPVGEAIETRAGRLKAKYVIHAPTMEVPGRTNIESVRKATMAALLLAKRLGIRTIAFPGMGTGVGGVNKEEATRAMVAVVREFAKEGGSVEQVIFVAFTKSLEDAFNKALEGSR